MIVVHDLAGGPHPLDVRDVAGWEPLGRGTALHLRDGSAMWVEESADELGRRIDEARRAGE